MTPPGKRRGPMGFDVIELAPELVGEPRLDLVRPVRARLEQRPPIVERKGVAPAHSVIRGRDVEARQRVADAGAVLGADSARPHAFEEAHDCRRACAQLPKRVAVAAPERRRRRDPLTGHVLHQAEKERQVIAAHALFETASG